MRQKRKFALLPVQKTINCGPWRETIGYYWLRWVVVTQTPMGYWVARMEDNEEYR